MAATKKYTISGWGHYPKQECVVYRPEKIRQLEEIRKTHAGTLIARGSGRSYGDAALNAEGVVDCTRLNRFISFDAKKGVVKAQAGVTLAEIMDMAIPKGWFPPVIPGTKFVTLGGAVAGNVHGKNQYREGEIAQHVEELALRLPDGTLAQCSAKNNGELFQTTAGGLGMTGCIETVTLRLKPIQSTYMHTESQRVANIHDMVALFHSHRDSAEYMIGWIDHFAKGEALGRGVFQTASHAPAEKGKSLAAYKSSEPKISIPPIFPGFLLNRYSMAMYNKKRFLKVSKEPKQKRENLEGFFHPLDGIKNWNNLYGRAGLLQYQCLVPEGEDMATHLFAILKMIQEKNCFSYLAVVKYHGLHQGMMSFSSPGISLALDFPNKPKVRALLNQLDEYLCGIGGRVYLAKDARLARENFEAMYKEQLPAWRTVLKRIDPDHKIRSAMAARLNFSGDDTW